MSLSMYADEQAKYLDTFAIDGNVEPGAFKGMLGAGAKLIPKVGAQIARGASLIAAPVPIALDAMSTAFSTAPKSTLLQDMYFGATTEPAEKAVERWTPAPHEVGWATEAVYSVFGTIAPIILAPIPTITSMAVDTAREVHSKPGVSLPQALGVGAVAGLSQYAGVKATLWGRGELEAIGIAAGFNWAQGIVTRGAQSAILSGTEAQKSFEPFGLKEQAIDVLMALAMTPAFRRMKSVREEGQRDFYSIEQGLKRWYKGDEGKSPFEAEVSPGAKAVLSAMREWAENAKPSDVDALMAVRQARHLAVDSLPGRPSSPASIENHVTRLKAEIGALLTDTPVVRAPDVPPETIDQFTSRAGEEIGGVSHLRGIVESLQRTYIEQGPEAGRAMLDEQAANAPQSSGFYDEVKTPGFLDELHTELAARAQDYHDKQQPFAPDPARQAAAEDIVRAMHEAAPRIAAEEGLPPGPTILLPIRDQLRAHMIETGFRRADGTWRQMTPSEADQYLADHAALDEVNLRQMSAMTGGKMSPEQLLHRYLADVKMRASVPEGALEQGSSTWYHSALARAIDNVPTKAQPAQGWKDWLKGQIQKGAIKADEVKYTGLEEYLDLQQGKITKEQLQTFMQEGGVRVEEVELGAYIGKAEDIAKAFTERTGDQAFDGYDRPTPAFENSPEFIEWHRVFDDMGGDRAAEQQSPRFSQWQLPGAKDGSYRELALVLPKKSHVVTDDQVATLARQQATKYGANWNLLSREAKDSAIANARRTLEDGPGNTNYAVPGGHSMGAGADINRLAHIRFNERAGPNGERVLFIEEIQSDWAQQLRKDGTVPPAPFVGKTEAWVGLSLKRMIRYAVENGFDQIAWTTGAQQAERYDLSKQVDHIDYRRNGDKYELGVVGKNGEGVTLPKDSFTAAELEDVVGKEVAKKIVNGEGQSGGGRMTLRGLDLKVGGEGMKGFYDKIVPTVAKDVLKKLGGGKVDVVNLKTPDEMTPLEKLQEARDASGMTMNEWMRMTSQEQKAATEEYWRNKPVETMAQQGLTITPEMRTKAMESQALFQRAGHMSPHTFDRFDHSHMSKGEGAQVYGWGTYLFTKQEVGDWYYNNFKRAAEKEASIALVDMDRAREWMDGNLPSAMRPAADLYIQRRNEGMDRTAAANEAMALWDSTTKPGDLYAATDGVKVQTALASLEARATKTLTSRDSPAYKTPDGQVVHESQSGQKKLLASAIGQVEKTGYARAASTFDNLITHAQAHLDKVKRTNDLLRKEIHEQLSAQFEAVDERPSGWGDLEPKALRYTIIQIGAPKRKMAIVRENEFKPGTWSVRDPDTDYSLSGGTPLDKSTAERIAKDWNTDPERTGRYEAGSELAESPQEAIEKHRAGLRRALENYDALDASAQDRVDETKRQRALVDEITTEPTPVPIKVIGGPAGEFSYLIPDNTGGTVVKISHSTPKASWEYQRTGDTAGITRQGFQTKEEALAHAVSQVRTLKPGYETVKPTIKPVRKYTVEAPENDIIFNWETRADQQPAKVQDILAKNGIRIIDEEHLLETAQQMREMDEAAINSDDRLSPEDKHVELLSLSTPDGRYYRERALEFLQDMLADHDTKFVVAPDATGRDIYIEMMKQFGYMGGRLDGPNTKFAAAASQAFSSMGIPGHRFYDGSSRTGRARDRTYNLVVYDESAMDIVHMEQDKTRGFLNIGDDRKMTMGFLQATNPSTPIHERAHFFLEMLDDLSKEYPMAAAEMDVLFKEWSLDRATWDKMSLDDKRFYHEQFARSWEAYLMSNKAPTPELRSVFRRFRDWLVAIYESAQTLNVKVSTEMRELFDRLHGSQLLDPSTDPAATAAASGAPPPPRPGVESQPPGAVDPFADLAGEPGPYVAKTVDDQDMREHLRHMVDQELGWAQIGGRNLGGMNGVPNFSTWIPRAQWWAERPDNIKKLKEHEYEAAVAKALVGDKLKPIEQRAVDFMMHVANERMQAEHTMGKADWLDASTAVHEAGLEPTTRNVVDADAVAIAHQIDEGQVERLAIQYDDDDAGFMAEIRRIIDDHENPETPAGSQENGGQPAQQVPAAGPAAETGGQPAGRAAAGSDSVDLLAQEADRFALENPALTMEVDMPDGTTRKMTAAEYLADVRESAAMAREDSALFHVAAQCLLGAS